jgi:hypothetical protein
MFGEMILCMKGRISENNTVEGAKQTHGASRCAVKMFPISNKRVKERRMKEDERERRMKERGE